VLLAGAGLLCLVSVVVGGAPLLDRLRIDLQGAFGYGWPLPVAASLAVGGLWIWPRPVPLRQAHVGAGLVGAVAVLGLLSVADDASRGRRRRRR